MPHWTASLHHANPAPQPYRIGDTVTLRLRADRDAPITHVIVRTTPDGEQHLAPMQPAGKDTVCRWWTLDLPLTMPTTQYRFYVVSTEGTWWLTAAGPVRHEPTDATDFKLLAGYAAPDWVRDSVFYQIFPERFADGDPSNNVRDHEYTRHGFPTLAKPWGAIPTPYNKMKGIEFFGGDLPGIIQKLDMLAELGINALYLNPIFTSPTNHKYDITDFKAVDPHFGGDAALIDLRRALDARGMRVILDITPNHCGSRHPWFLAAKADPAAPTAGYFFFDNHHGDYVGWLGHKSLVKLNYQSAGLREAMYGGPDAALRYWLRDPFRADGWRFDVANMTARQGESQLAEDVWREIRAALKAEHPDAYLMGETFFDGSPLLQGDKLDGVMNYRGFSRPLEYWLAGIDSIRAVAHINDGAVPIPLPSEALAGQWLAYLGAIPWQIALQQFNLLGSHDTQRILTRLGGDQDRLRVALALLFTFPGVPSIYYGDEIGMIGKDDPDNRRCMIWDTAEWDHDLRAYTQTLIRLRRESPALRRGGFQMIYAAGDTVAFLRESPDERLIVVARRGTDGLDALPVRHAGVPDGLRLRDVIGGGAVTVAGGHLPLNTGGTITAQIWRTAE
ncbi:MAG: alpha amylase N-terminal ig-like domain-containing protein [Anaerolineae bacterium]|nr:alpha amylase N-terminal ig-like domain-containing protein [Anaerolineae bacterium]